MLLCSSFGWLCFRNLVWKSKVCSSQRMCFEAVTRGALWEKVFLETLQHSQENTWARVSFLIKLQALALFLKAKISKNIFFTEHLWSTASGVWIKYHCSWRFNWSPCNFFEFILRCRNQMDRLFYLRTICYGTNPFSHSRSFMFIMVDPNLKQKSTKNSNSFRNQEIITSW